MLRWIPLRFDTFLPFENKKKNDGFREGWCFPAAAFTVEANLYVKRWVISVETRLVMSDTQPHIELLLAETCLLIGILSSACVPCYFICIEYSRFQLFLNSALFFPRRSAFSLPPCAHKENNSGTSRAEVSSPFQSGVISLFTFQEISILHPGCVYFPWFSLQFDITQRPCHIPLMLFLKSSASISFIPFVPQIHFVSVYPLCAAPLNYSHHIFRLFKLSYEQPEQPVQRFYKFCFFRHANP